MHSLTEPRAYFPTSGWWFHDDVDGARLRDHDDLGAGVDPEQQAGRHSVDVKERDRPQEDFLTPLGLVEPRRHLERVGDQVRVGQHRGFGRARRAAGVLEQRDVRPGDRDLRRRGRVLVDQARPEEDVGLWLHLDQLPVLSLNEMDDRPPRESERLGHVHHDDPLDLGRFADLTEARKEHVEQDDGLDPRVVELLFHLPRDVERVGVDRDRADPEERVEGDRELRAVRQHDRDAIALAHAELVESGGEPQRGVPERAIAHPRRRQLRVGVERQGGLVAELGRGAVEQVGQRPRRIDDGLRNAILVELDPRCVHDASWDAAGRCYTGRGTR
jgi:hypothetical protein